MIIATCNKENPNIFYFSVHNRRDGGVGLRRSRWFGIFFKRYLLKGKLFVYSLSLSLWKSMGRFFLMQTLMLLWVVSNMNSFVGCGLCVYLRQLLARQEEALFNLWSQVQNYKPRSIVPLARYQLWKSTSIFNILVHVYPHNVKGLVSTYSRKNLWISLMYFKLFLNTCPVND